MTTYRLGDTLDVVTKDLAVTLRATPVDSRTVVGLSEQHVQDADKCRVATDATRLRDTATR